MHGNKKYNPRTSKLEFRTTLEVEDAIKHLAEKENKTVSTYLHDVVFNHYCKLMQEEAVQEARATGKLTLGYLLNAVEKMQ